MIEIMMLPYLPQALEPFISQTTIEYHYGKHYQNYVNTLNELIKGTKFEGLNLEEIILQSHGNPETQKIYNNAGQVYNHEFYFKHLDPQKRKDKTLKQRIIDTFGSYENFKKQFTDKALSVFGSGWTWLVDNNGKLEIVNTANADNPVILNVTPILCLDVWEHAYYLDYQNKRKDYISAYLDNLIL